MKKINSLYGYINAENEHDGRKNKRLYVTMNKDAYSASEVVNKDKKLMEKISKDEAERDKELKVLGIAGFLWMLILGRAAL